MTGTIKYVVPKAITANSATSANSATQATNAQHLLAQTLSGTSKETYVYSVGNTVYTSGNLEVPAYTKGIFICPGGNDAVIIGVTSSNKIFFAYRNGTSWNTARQL